MKVLKVLASLGFEKRDPRVRNTLEYSKLYPDKEGRAARVTLVISTDKETGLTPTGLLHVLCTMQRSVKPTPHEVSAKAPEWCREHLLTVLECFEDKETETHPTTYTCEVCGKTTPETVEGRCFSCAM